MQVDLPPIVGKLQPYMGNPGKNIIKIHTLRWELAEARAEALEVLQNKRKQMLWPKDKDLTELDRKTRMDGDCAPYQKNYEFLIALEEIIKDTIRVEELGIPEVFRAKRSV